MLQRDVEELVCLISTLDRESATSQLLNFHADFPVDFTPEYLAEQDLEYLQHLLFALCMQSNQFPTDMRSHAPAAA